MTTSRRTPEELRFHGAGVRRCCPSKAPRAYPETQSQRASKATKIGAAHQSAASQHLACCVSAFCVGGAEPQYPRTKKHICHRVKFDLMHVRCLRIFRDTSCCLEMRTARSGAQWSPGDLQGVSESRQE